jgi:hypothetical protein
MNCIAANTESVPGSFLNLVNVVLIHRLLQTLDSLAFCLYTEKSKRHAIFTHSVFPFNMALIYLVFIIHTLCLDTCFTHVHKWRSNAQIWGTTEITTYTCLPPILSDVVTFAVRTSVQDS